MRQLAGHMGVVSITTPINICMKQFRATVKASDLVVTTVVFAENTNSAMKILQAQFGAKNVIGIPTQMGNG